MTSEQVSSNEQAPFQRRVIDWMMETFSMQVCRDTTERNHRFLEEALELVQAFGCTAAEAHMLVDYVYGRPTGEPEQEIGGVMVTLAALCAAADLSMVTCGDVELERCWRNIDRIRAKQATKPRGSPLPGSSPSETAAAPPSNPITVTELRRLADRSGLWGREFHQAADEIERLTHELAATDQALHETQQRLASVMNAGSADETSAAHDIRPALYVRHPDGSYSPHEPAVKADGEPRAPSYDPPGGLTIEGTDGTNTSVPIDFK